MKTIYKANDGKEFDNKEDCLKHDEDDRRFKGAYYTPLNVVDKAYDKLTETLGENWQKEYIVWDMCCGVGNLEVKHSNHRNIYMSTLDQADIDIMKATKTCVAAQRFQYDYLNDDITDDGKIDYTLTNKVPEGLRKAIREGKKILVLINPPYAEASDMGGKNKAGVAKTKFSKFMDCYGKASNELFTQFVARVIQEIPNATLAIFSTLKYVNAPNFEKFRHIWSAEYNGGFIIHSKAFEGLNGDFPIGFLIWKINQKNKQITPITKIVAEVLDKKVKPIGEKSFYNIPNRNLLNNWIDRPKANKNKVIPLKNSIAPATSLPIIVNWADNAIAYMNCGSNDLQHASNLTAIYSSSFGSGHGLYITKDNLWQAAIVFSVRRLIKPTWLNDRDQFLQPDKELTKEFKNDCLVWMLFNGSNLTASANDLDWNNQKWSIVNHFIPFTEDEVGAPERFESDFMVQYLAGKQFSDEAKLVLYEGKKLWQSYFSTTDNITIKNELKLNRSDVGWYQVRKALQARNKEGDCAPINFKPFETAYINLTEKLRPQVYEFGFLKN